MTPMPRVRHSVVLLALVINMVCYTDRVCIAVAGAANDDSLRPPRISAAAVTVARRRKAARVMAGCRVDHSFMPFS